MLSADASDWLGINDTSEVALVAKFDAPAAEESAHEPDLALPDGHEFAIGDEPADVALEAFS